MIKVRYASIVLATIVTMSGIASSDVFATRKIFKSPLPELIAKVNRPLPNYEHLHTWSINHYVKNGGLPLVYQRIYKKIEVRGEDGKVMFDDDGNQIMEKTDEIEEIVVSPIFRDLADYLHPALEEAEFLALMTEAWNTRTATKIMQGMEAHDVTIKDLQEYNEEQEGKVHEFLGFYNGIMATLVKSLTIEHVDLPLANDLKIALLNAFKKSPWYEKFYKGASEQSYTTEDKHETYPTSNEHQSQSLSELVEILAQKKNDLALQKKELADLNTESETLTTAKDAINTEHKKQNQERASAEIFQMIKQTLQKHKNFVDEYGEDYIADENVRELIELLLLEIRTENITN